MTAVALHQPIARGATMNDLSRELEAFRNALPSLLAHARGKFALVIGDQVKGTFETYGDALQEGYAEAGATPFLVKRIDEPEEVSHFSRPLSVPCRL